MGDVLRELGQAQAAREAYEKELALALELAKDESQARYHLDLSIIYGRLGDVQLALRDKGGAGGVREAAGPVPGGSQGREQSGGAARTGRRLHRRWRRSARIG